MTQIPKQDAPLYIDVTCYRCKRCVALSNAIERDGRYYCERCLYPTVGSDRRDKQHANLGSPNQRKE